MTLDPEALDDLLEMVENNTEELKRACEMLNFYFSEGAHIGSEDVDHILYHSKEESVFTLFDKIAARDLEGALDIYSKLRLAAQGEIVQLLGGLLWQIRKLLETALLLEAGINPDQAFRSLKIFGKKRQDLFLSGTRITPLQNCSRESPLLRNMTGKPVLLKKKFSLP
jgi:DNA polymerase-3 subunit delta